MTQPQPHPIAPSGVLAVLRRLAEQHDYAVLAEGCREAGAGGEALEVLHALAEARLGAHAEAERRLADVDRSQLDVAARVDLAAVWIALGKRQHAVTELESARGAAEPCVASVDALLRARLAWCRAELGDDAVAIELYRESLALRPQIGAYRNLLRLLKAQGELGEMARWLEAAWSFWQTDEATWPAALARVHRSELERLQLCYWLADDALEAAETWLLERRTEHDETAWCALLVDWSRELAGCDRHIEAAEWLRVGLRHYPENIALHRQLAELAALAGRTQQAVALMRRAIRLAAGSNLPTHTLWLAVSAMALQAQPGLARAAAERARDELSRAPLDAVAEGDGRRIELALADVDAREGQVDAAQARYRAVLEEEPASLPALEGLGRLALQLGRIDEAAERFEAVKDIDSGRGHAALIAMRRLPEDEATLTRLTSLAHTPSIQGSVRAGLLFQLAAAWDARGEHEQAFACAEQANAATRRWLRYDPAEHRARCARIRHAFPKALYAHRQNSGLASTLPVFVVGMPRSGTTLVEQMLASHSRIHGAGELDVIPRVIAGLERWERHTGSGRHFPDCVDDLDPGVLRGVAERVLQELALLARDAAPNDDREQPALPDVAHVVDKLPHNFQNIGLIKLLFPNAKIVSVRRDPRDIAVSSYLTDFAARHHGMGYAYDLDWLGEQLADHNLLMHHWHGIFPGELLELSYEALVADPEECARRLLDYVGVDWQPAVLDFHTHTRQVKTASLWQVRQPLYTSATARWQRYRQHLAPLIAATNRKIGDTAIEMVTLPEPGWLNRGVDRYREEDLDGAEGCFKRLLHHLPQHAAARFMLGLVYLRKGYLDDAIPLMAWAVERCPWQARWRSDLAEAYRLAGRAAEAEALAASAPLAGPGRDQDARRLDYLFLSEDSLCSNTPGARA